MRAVNLQPASIAQQKSWRNRMIFLNPPYLDLSWLGMHFTSLRPAYMVCVNQEPRWVIGYCTIPGRWGGEMKMCMCRLRKLAGCRVQVQVQVQNALCAGVGRGRRVREGGAKGVAMLFLV